MKINVICPQDASLRINNCIPPISERSDMIEFFFNGKELFYDGIIVLQSTSRYDIDDVRCKLGNTLLVIREPQDILRLPKTYISQFDHVLTPNSKIKGLHTIYSQFGQLWSFDKSFQELRRMTIPEKEAKISAVISTKAITRGHKQRLNFVKGLKKELGDKLDWYGRGVCEVEDKWNAIAPYQYHLVFENGIWPDYWTEKLTDAFMGFSMPIYVGCPNISDYFMEQSMIILKKRNMSPKIVAGFLADIIDSSTYTKNLEHIVNARNKILNKYSLYHTLTNIVDNYFDRDSIIYKKLSFESFENIVYQYSLTKRLRRIKKQLIG